MIQSAALYARRVTAGRGLGRCGRFVWVSPVWARVLAARVTGSPAGWRGLDIGDFDMMTFSRALAFGRALLADRAGMSSVQLAVVIGLASSAVLVVVRVAIAMPNLGH